MNNSYNEPFWFPGRWVGGFTLMLGPFLLLIGVLLRIQYHFFFPQQLAAFNANPLLITASYSTFLAGNILMWPAIVTLTQQIGVKKPGWAWWGGTMVIFGLFARTFHAGIDHLAFQLVHIHEVEQATKTVADAYGAFHIVSVISPLIMFGWIILAIGAYLSGTLGLIRSVALGLMAMLMIGVLKGSSVVSVIATAGLCIALVPLGVKVLRAPPVPGYRVITIRLLFFICLLIFLFFFGQLG